MSEEEPAAGGGDDAKISKRIPRPTGASKRPPKSGAAATQKTGRVSRSKVRARTGLTKRTGATKGRKKDAPVTSEKELEPITAFKRGISVGVKFAGFTALVVGVFMGLLGVLTYSITSEQMDAQINEQGISLAGALEESLDREIWIAPPEPNVEDPNNKNKVFLRTKTREEVLAEWRPRFEEIVEGSESRILAISLINTDQNNKPTGLVMAYPSGDKISIQTDQIIGDQMGVYITEGVLGNERVRRFEKPVSIKLFSQNEAVAGISKLAEAEDKGDEAAAKAARETMLSEAQVPPDKHAELLSSQDFENYFGQHPRSEWREGEAVRPVLWVFVKASRLDDVKKQLKTRIAVVTLCGAVAGILLTVLISAVLTGPIRELEGDITEVASGNMEHQSRVTSTDEIGALAHVFNIMARNLRTAQENAVERKAFERELNIAKEIQEKLLPERIPQIPGIDIHSFYNSAKEVGGDYYDFIVIDQAHLGIIVADVAGKGIPGAMVMTMARSLVRLASVRNVSPGDTFKKVNRILAKDIRRGMFVTSAYMVLNVKTKTLKVASAGHNPVVLYRARTGENELLKPKGIALGFDKGTIFDNNINEVEVQLEPGDRLVTYTDGVNEAMNNESEEFGDDRFYTLVKEHARKTSKEFVDALVTALDGHRGDAEQSDDITIVTLSVDDGGEK